MSAMLFGHKYWCLSTVSWLAFVSAERPARCGDCGTFCLPGFFGWRAGCFGCGAK